MRTVGLGPSASLLRLLSPVVVFAFGSPTNVHFMKKIGKFGVLSIRMFTVSKYVLIIVVQMFSFSERNIFKSV